MNFKTWINGLVGAIIGAAANGLTLLIVDPIKFSPATGGWSALGVSTLVSGLVGAALYLKQHPTPFEDTVQKLMDGK